MAQSYPLLGRELFQVAFVSIWQELTDTNQDSLVKALQVAFSSQSIPPEILQQLLNLAEFMEHDFTPLPIPPNILAGLYYIYLYVCFIHA
jgi:FKBP12-rapamycin complex-associated protein